MLSAKLFRGLFVQEEDGIRDSVACRGIGDVCGRQGFNVGGATTTMWEVLQLQCGGCRGFNVGGATTSMWEVLQLQCGGCRHFNAGGGTTSMWGVQQRPVSDKHQTLRTIRAARLRLVTSLVEPHHKRLTNRHLFPM